MTLTAEQLRHYYETEGQASLATAKGMLKRAGIACEAQVLVGAVAESIVGHARTSGADLIMMATRGMGAGGNLLLGSVTTKVLYCSTAVPVLVVNAS
jgi:nucleotide-binding universal stress UspA family protein